MRPYVSGLSIVDIPRMLAKLRANSTLNQNGCWIWNGAVRGKGYGTVHVKEFGQVYLHRLMAHLYLEMEMDSPALVLHKCDTPQCFNPDHLFLGDHSANVRDCIQKGRYNRNDRAKGEQVNTAKLTVEQVAEIRSMNFSGQTTYEAVGFRYGVTGRTISNIVNRRNWRSYP